jgi:CheY-like chemotaxis protein
VATAESGTAALDILAQGMMPDMIVTDMHMPGMDGLDLARRVRALPGGATLPLVLLSSGFMPSGTDGTRLFNARLLKPARQVQLFETLARCLTPHAATPQAAARADERRHVTVLVVDDNAVNLKVACGMLARLGYDTVTADDGLQAVAEVEGSPGRGAQLRRRTHGPAHARAWTAWRPPLCCSSALAPQPRP